MKISIQNLKQGLSSFSENIAADFIDNKYSKYYPNDFSVYVELDKIEKDFRARILMKSVANYICDRCLKDFKIEIELQQEQIYKTGSTIVDTDEDIIILPVDAVDIDLTNVLNEMVVLNHPIKMLCKESCKGICPNCGTDLNNNECRCEEAETDPRWDELRKLIK